MVGSVEIYRTVRDRKVVLATLGAGSVVGGMEWITGMHRLTAVAALDDTIVSAVDRDKFESLILEDPDNAVQLPSQVYRMFNHLIHPLTTLPEAEN